MEINNDFVNVKFLKSQGFNRGYWWPSKDEVADVFSYQIFVPNLSVEYVSRPKSAIMLQIDPKELDNRFKLCLKEMRVIEQVIFF